MADLDSTAVITEEEFLRTVGKSKDNAKIDTQQLIEMINQVTEFLESYLQRKIVAPASAMVETINGICGSVYYVDNMRITSVTLLEEFDSVDNTTGAITWNTRTIADRPYVFDQDDGKFELISHDLYGGRWRLSYETGWAQASVPGPIKSVAISLVQRMIKLVSGKDGLSSVNFGDQSTTFDLDQKLTKRHRTELSRYRRM